MILQISREETKAEVVNHKATSPYLNTRQEDSTANVDGALIWAMPHLELLRLFVWSVMLMIVFGLCRFMCIGHGDLEYCRTLSVSDVFDNLSALLLMGITLFLFTGIHSSIRFNYIYGFSADTGYSGVWFLLTLVATPVVMKGLGTTPMSSFNFTGPGLSNNLMLVGLTSVLFLFTLCWHIYSAHLNGVLMVFVVSRFIVLMYFILNILFCLNQCNVWIHVHHYQLGWFVAMLGCCNHPISLITLSFGTALMVEGLSVFGPDSMCLRYT